MKLYVYDHCPYCVRARMPFGLKGIPYASEILPYGDEDTPMRLIGQKTLPILEDQDGFMGESLDIVRKVDAIDGRPLFGGEPRAETADWIAAWSKVLLSLVAPRTPNAIFPEFQSKASRDYYIEKKQPLVGDFQELLSKTDELAPRMEQGLSQLDDRLGQTAEVAIDDILLFPMLRSLTNVPELRFPPGVRSYLERLSDRSEVSLIRAVR